MSSALSAFEYLLADIEFALSEGFFSCTRPAVSRDELRLLSLIAACQDGPSGLGGRLARDLVGEGRDTGLMVRAANMGQVTAEAGFTLPVRLAELPWHKGAGHDEQTARLPWAHDNNKTFQRFRTCP